MREKLSDWLLFVILVEGVIFLTILIVITLYRMFTGF